MLEVAGNGWEWDAIAVGENAPSLPRLRGRAGEGVAPRGCNVSLLNDGDSAAPRALSPTLARFAGEGEEAAAHRALQYFADRNMRTSFVL